MTERLCATTAGLTCDGAIGSPEELYVQRPPFLNAPPYLNLRFREPTGHSDSRSILHDAWQRLTNPSTDSNSIALALRLPTVFISAHLLATFSTSFLRFYP